MKKEWYDLDVGAFDEALHDALCVRCNMCLGPCKCEYDFTSEDCGERSRHEELSFMVKAAQRMLYRM